MKNIFSRKYFKIIPSTLLIILSCTSICHSGTMIKRDKKTGTITIYGEGVTKDIIDYCQKSTSSLRNLNLCIQSNVKNKTSNGYAKIKTTKRQNRTNNNVPHFNIKSHCRHVKKTVNGGYYIEEGCIKNEEKAKETLRSMYIDKEIAKHCLHVTNTVNGAYWLYLGCVRNEINAKNRIK